jgi:hypothetical protein
MDGPRLADEPDAKPRSRTVLSSCDLRAHWYRVAQSITLRDGVEVFDIVMEAV